MKVCSDRLGGNFLNINLGRVKSIAHRTDSCSLSSTWDGLRARSGAHAQLIFAAISVHVHGRASFAGVLFWAGRTRNSVRPSSVAVGCWAELLGFTDSAPFFGSFAHSAFDVELAILVSGRLSMVHFCRSLVFFFLVGEKKSLVASTYRMFGLDERSREHLVRRLPCNRGSPR